MTALVDRYTLLSLSHEDAALDAIAGWVQPREAITASLAAWKAELGVDELLYLATCNRVCFIAAGDPSCDPHEMLARLGRMFGQSPRAAWRVQRGAEAVAAVFSIAAGLHSAVRGEAEIAAQMQVAWRRARRARTSFLMLDLLLRDALQAAAAARAQDGLSPSLADWIVPEIAAEGPGCTVALIGSSSLTQRCGAMLAARGHRILAISRSAERAQGFASRCGGMPMTLQDFLSAPPRIGAIISAAGGTEPVITRAHAVPLLADASAAPLVFDLGVPPNVSAHAAVILGPRYRDMRRLMDEARDGRVGLDAREGRISLGVRRFLSALAEREAGKLVGAWRMAGASAIDACREPAAAHAEILQLKRMAVQHGFGTLLEHLREVAA